MLALHIRQLQHHSHFHGAATASVRKRVDAALAAALDNELEAAMLSAGIDSDEEICIRRIRMRSALSLRRSDRQLAADLSLGWVDELRRAIERVDQALDDKSSSDNDQ